MQTAEGGALLGTPLTRAYGAEDWKGRRETVQPGCIGLLSSLFTTLSRSPPYTISPTFTIALDPSRTIIFVRRDLVPFKGWVVRVANV